MNYTRRWVLTAGAMGLGLAGCIGPHIASAKAQGSDNIPADGGEITVHPVGHASIVLEAGDMTIYVDPVGEASAYQAFSAPDLILITHEHPDHFNVDLLNALASNGTKIIANPAVFELLPEALQGMAAQMANGERTEVAGIGIEAVPAYNTTQERLRYHPQGRDNGYVLSLSGVRIYIAGDTEDTPEMRGLQDIDLAFVPMNLPFTMSVEQAADAVIEFKPKVVYPYHYRGNDVDQFKSLVDQSGAEIEVRLAKWY